jgi:hypothetical protein
MTESAIMQLAAVVVGGLLATGGGILTTLFIENQKRRYESTHLAMAFKGEIGALVQQIEERNYLGRISEVIRQMQETGEPFYMPLRVHYRYDRVYENNVERIGLLKPPLAERIPRFYTRVTSALDDFTNLADRVYAGLEISVLVRVYQDLHRMLDLSLQEGREILREIDVSYRRR